MQAPVRHLLELSRKLYRYRIFRWALYSVVGLVVFDRLAMHATDRFELLPRKPVVFPHQDIPAAQESTLREILYAANTLSKEITPVLLPENSDDAHLAYYDAIMTNLETRHDISWLVLEETSLISSLRGLHDNRQRRIEGAKFGWAGIHNEAGVPLTPAEERLYAHFNVANRGHALYQHFDAERVRKAVATWDPDYVNTFVPPFRSLSPLETAPAIVVDEGQAAEAMSEYDSLMSRRYHAISYLKLHPPKPMGWAPLTSDAWAKTRKSDIDSGNLHGRPEWKPIYRKWDLEDVPIGWKERKLTKEEEDAELQRLIKSNKEYQDRDERIKQFLSELREHSTS
ncbi:hypothetical protein K461DRAFT_129309 [Myriangium duriaei CBS 260.36]|uniref:Uncharacterized protein n=1 Tax=Myriangium duriaei CBS 260.36 TaxID=1168546 RepID=A0A9P4J2U4_9PEZI|nr:hypothetical protein K461DRAFT_129309 [Myriangium duriaei CBS 260.36]